MKTKNTQMLPHAIALLTSLILVSGSNTFAADTPSNPEEARELLHKKAHTLNCTPYQEYGDYLKPIQLKVDDKKEGASYLNNYYNKKKKAWEISWSETECEDYTEYLLDDQRYTEALRKGKGKIPMEFKHETPDTTIKAYYTCELSISSN